MSGARLWIKVCGLRTVEAIDAAVDAGADAVGFVFHAASPRNLDYATARVPIVLTRTRTQADLLGDDYPLFVDSVDDALPVLRGVLADADLYRRAADLAYQASRAYTYPAVHRLIAPYLAEPGGPAASTTPS